MFRLAQGGAPGSGLACNGRDLRSGRALPLSRTARSKFRNILPHWNRDMEPVRCALAGIVLSQTLAQAVGLHPHDGIGVLIEGRSAMEDFHPDGIFLNLVGFPIKEPFA